MQIYQSTFLIVLCLFPSIGFAQQALFDLDAIRDVGSLETVVLHDWQPDPRNPTVRQKLVEITVCEWWPGQKIRLPVTLSAPAGDSVCRNILVANQPLANKTARLSTVQLELIKKDSVGVVLIGMGTIDMMEPAGQLHHEMRRQLLKTKDARYSPAWIWGISQMRALTAAAAEHSVFQPVNVLAIGGSKRGIATAAAGIFDERFTAILPVVAPPLGNPGGSYVLGTEDDSVTRTNQQFLADLESGRLGLPSSASQSLEARSKRRSNIRITLDQAHASNWSAEEIAAITDRVWDASRIVDHLPALKQRGLQIFYNVGTNDSVSPALLELGNRVPDFPICIIPGGQHGGPADAGYTRRVPQVSEIQDNLLSFARCHFHGARKMIAAPQIDGQWNAETRIFRVSVTFPKTVQPQKNEIWWSLNRSEPYTLPFEYDSWTSVPLTRDESGTYRAELTFSKTPARLDYVSLHTHTQNDLPLTISSPYRRADLTQ